MTSIVDCGDVRLAYETFGDSDQPAIVLVMGLGTQMLGWDAEFCTMLASSGFLVIRFDNRDVGLSTHLHDAGVPDLSPLLSGGQITSAPYLLADMADDTAGLIAALDLGEVHLVGASMGGMIAQEVALRHPQRVLTLTSIMSTPGPHVGAATPEAAAALFAPPATTLEEAGLRAVSIGKAIGSPRYPLNREETEARARESFRRAHDPGGVARQLVAIHRSGDRTERLGRLALPALVLHGEDDPLVGVEGGYATARAIPGARLVTYPGMGHDLPRPLWPDVVAEIDAVASRV